MRGERVEFYRRRVGGGFVRSARGVADVRAYRYAFVVASGFADQRAVRCRQIIQHRGSFGEAEEFHSRNVFRARDEFLLEHEFGDAQLHRARHPRRRHRHGYGSYTKIGTAQVKVTMCAKQTAAAFSVGTQALVYNSSGASQNLGAVILTGPGDPTCVSETFLFYTAHLKVHAFIGGSHGTIAKTGPVLTLY